MRISASVLLAAYLCVPAGWAQSNSPSPSNSSGAAPSATQGTATIENQLITYEVLRQMSDQIATKVSENAHSCTDAAPRSVLLYDPSAIAGITMYKSFLLSADALTVAYGGKLEGEIQEFAFSDAASAVSSLLTAIKNSATYTNQTFQPTTQSMTTLLTMSLRAKEYSLRTTSLPGDLDSASEFIQGKLNEISLARRNADDKTRTKLDPEFSALRTALSSTSPDGTLLVTLIKGRALFSSLTGQGNDTSRNYCVLTVSVDAAGGDTRTKHWFWQELIMPTPKPSYNGGAVVSYILADKAGSVLNAGMLHYMYDFSKWKGVKLPNTVNFSPPQVEKPKKAN
jgi:hypothetical protein